MLFVGVVQCGAAFQEGMLHPRVGDWGLCRCLSQWEELSCGWEELVTSEVAMPELWLESSSNSCLPVFYLQSLFMGFFTAPASTHLSEPSVHSVSALSLM